MRMHSSYPTAASLPPSATIGDTTSNFRSRVLYMLRASIRTRQMLRRTFVVEKQINFAPLEETTSLQNESSLSSRKILPVDSFMITHEEEAGSQQLPAYTPSVFLEGRLRHTGGVRAGDLLPLHIFVGPTESLPQHLDLQLQDIAIRLRETTKLSIGHRLRVSVKDINMLEAHPKLRLMPSQDTQMIEVDPGLWNECRIPSVTPTLCCCILDKTYTLQVAATIKSLRLQKSVVSSNYRYSISRISANW